MDDEEGVGVWVASAAEALAGVFEGVGDGGEDDAAVEAADEVEAEFALDELERRRHFVERPRKTRKADPSSRGKGRRALSG